MRIFIACILLFVTFTTPALANESTVRCPTIENMHQSANAISDAALIDNSYVAVTMPFAIHTVDIGWFAVVYNIRADSINDAIEKGRLAMLAISTQVSEFARDLGGTYVCKYDGGKIQTLSNDDDWRRLNDKLSFFSKLELMNA